jgi:hypothetical protein
MPDHNEQPASALAHGATKSDTDRVRRDVNSAEVRVAHDDRCVATRRERRIRNRQAQSTRDAQPPAG